jgi:hypothetical protein
MKYPIIRRELTVHLHNCNWYIHPIHGTDVLGYVCYGSEVITDEILQAHYGLEVDAKAYHFLLDAFTASPAFIPDMLSPEQQKHA